MDLLAKPARRTKKIQVYLTQADFEILRSVAERNGEAPGAVASRCISHAAVELRSSLSQEATEVLP
jgi:hypothetical protein